MEHRSTCAHGDHSAHSWPLNFIAARRTQRFVVGFYGSYDQKQRMSSMSTDRSHALSRHHERPSSLSRRFRQSPMSLNRRAENSGFIQDLIRSTADCDAYMLYRRNLLYVYSELEGTLEAHRNDPPVGLVARPMLYRRQTIVHHLSILLHDGTSQSLPLLPTAMVYARRIILIGRDCPSLRVEHAYTRYLGDLNGGRIFKRILSNRLGIACDALTFFDYDDISDPSKAAKEYRAAIDAPSAESLYRRKSGSRPRNLVRRQGSSPGAVTRTPPHRKSD